MKPKTFSSHYEFKTYFTSLLAKKQMFAGGFLQHLNACVSNLTLMTLHPNSSYLHYCFFCRLADTSFDILCLMYSCIY